MSNRRRVGSGLLAVLGGATLALGISVRRANAVPPFSNANYINRYVCSESATSNTLTALLRVDPDGNGGYTSGTLQAPVTLAFTPGTPSTNFCAYTLQSSSAYVVTSNGTGLEVLSWVASATNNAACPADFTMSDAFVMRAEGIRKNGAVIRTSLTTDNLLGGITSGEGYCLKE